VSNIYNIEHPKCDGDADSDSTIKAAEKNAGDDGIREEV
jgi:hypothetical protein